MRNILLSFAFVFIFLVVRDPKTDEIIKSVDLGDKVCSIAVVGKNAVITRKGVAKSTFTIINVSTETAK